MDKDAPVTDVTTSLLGIPADRRKPPKPAESCLIVIRGANIGGRIVLHKPDMVLGRSRAADIQIDEDAVSRIHAIIRKRQDSVLIEDQKSKNGTFVNNEKCSDRVLMDQDLIALGNTILKFIAGNSVEIAYHEELHKLATLDPMLQILNKRYFLDYLKQKCERARLARNLFSIILFDIDHFKRINDSYGHQAGDQVLVEMAHLVKANLRAGDIFSRYGGEEFAILLPQADAEQAGAVAEKLRRSVEMLTIHHEYEAITVTISLGVAVFALDDSPEILLARADHALYQAKRLGRNRKVVHQDFPMNILHP